jgi:peptidoglycan/xylan/chitin deacetylase (PgdA/CDA1 family)
MTGLPKRTLAAILLGSRVARPIPGAGGNALRILAYHRVLDDDPGSFPYDEGVISASTQGFRSQMAFVGKNFDVVSFEDLLSFEFERVRPPKRPLIITFDDGYRDNYTNAFPILRQAGLPATIFLAAGYIGNHRLFWWDSVAFCVKHTSRRTVTLPEISLDPISFASAADKRSAIDAILRWVKQAPDEIKNRFVERLPEELEIDQATGDAASMQLTWDEVRTMVAANIEFGSHTMTHPILSNVTSDALETEISGSKVMIEKELGKEIIAFAYPVGGKLHFNPRVQAAVARSGFRYAVSYINGLASLDRRLSTSGPQPAASAAGFSTDGLTTDRRAPDPFSMPRIHVEGGDSMNLFRANLMFPKVMLSGT